MISVYCTPIMYSTCGRVLGCSLCWIPSVLNLIVLLYKHPFQLLITCLCKICAEVYKGNVCVAVGIFGDSGYFENSSFPNVCVFMWMFDHRCWLWLASVWQMDLPPCSLHVYVPFLSLFLSFLLLTHTYTHIHLHFTLLALCCVLSAHLCYF